ncbi:MAG: Smr/MutS family protein [Sphingomonas sp.]|nr:Smr/MutS family protein [Sphingomonas sp.]MBW0007284.1 Smr/MutS family protein [Sphingomonas sp.]
MRRLSPEESELWARVASTIRPLSRQVEPRQAPEKLEQVVVRPRSTTTGSPPAPRSKPLPIADKTLDGSWDKKLRSGAIEPDRMLDLHGMNLDTAWNAIDRGLEQAIARGDRVVLLITGHHRPGDPPVQRGRIRAAVHDWLAASRHAQSIAAVRGAHRRHGGGGSLYLILRRKIFAR